MLLTPECAPRKRAKLVAALSLKPKLPLNAKCLDIGTSNGQLIYFIIENEDWTFVDPDPICLDIAKKILKGNFILAKGASALQDILENKYQLITLFDIIPYIEDLDVFLKLIRTRLSLDGYLLMTSVSHNEKSYMHKLRERYGLNLLRGFKMNYTTKEVQQLLIENNFKINKLSLFSGFFIESFQLVIDMMASKDESHYGTLTQRHLSPKSYLLHLLKYMTQVTMLFDRIFFFLPRYSFVILAEIER
jgi:2-polyprenyl-3-methyl-5-hydroxy-6-metoxy-1,4-benzoquinol methylase